MTGAFAEAEQLEAVLIAAEGYAIAVIREALHEPTQPDAPASRHQTTVEARGRLLDALAQLKE